MNTHPNTNNSNEVGQPPVGADPAAPPPSGPAPGYGLDDVFRLGVAIFVGGCLTIICFLLFVGYKIRADQRERYPDWVKLTGRTDITFEEFKRLDKGGYLRGGRK